MLDRNVLAMLASSQGGLAEKQKLMDFKFRALCKLVYALQICKSSLPFFPVSVQLAEKGGKLAFLTICFNSREPVDDGDAEWAKMLLIENKKLAAFT